MPPSRLTSRKRQVTLADASRSIVNQVVVKVGKLQQEMERLLTPTVPRGGFQLREVEFSEVAPPAREAAL
eukprot:3512889-Pleurochrysis_carterae.AAC.1